MRIVAWLSSVAALGIGIATLEGAPLDQSGAIQRCYVTNVAQFRGLSGEDYLKGCDFQLTGVVTLVDTNRNLLVLQDATGAVALNFRINELNIQVGQSVCLDGTNCGPYFSRFPDYPYRPAGRDIQPKFEAPTNWGEYHLTRMRGWLRPPVNGLYTFWIASDNSSELWLSSDANPSNVRRVAFIPNFSWVDAHEWSRFPSQRSDAISLKAGELYYIESLQEQSTGSEHLAVAWQGPAIPQSVIEGSYLIPWNQGRESTSAAKGIFREYWTNFSMGDLIGMGGARAFQSALTVGDVRVRIEGPGQLPQPDPISLNQTWQPEENYQWVAVEGTVNFAGGDEESGLIELYDGQGTAQVHVLGCNSESLRGFAGAAVRVEGVCEGVIRRGQLTPGLIWTWGTNRISIMRGVATNAAAWSEDRLAPSAVATNPMLGFFSTRGVVTFNDRVFDTDCIFVQEGGAAMRVYLQDSRFKDRLKVGQWMEIGGQLQPGKILSSMTPTRVGEIGWHLMPSPIDPFVGPEVQSYEGRWSELVGVVHSLNSNGTLWMVGRNGPVLLWIGHTRSNYLARYVDAKIRVRGVLTMDVLGGPGLLIPSRNFVNVEEAQPLETPQSCIADVLSQEIDAARTHRVRVAGEVTWRDGSSFFIQDESGGIRVRRANEALAQIGERVEVLGFPDVVGPSRSLNDAVVRAATPAGEVLAQELDLNKGLPNDQSGRLLTARGTLLSHKTNDVGQIFEFQQGERVFVATLAGSGRNLSNIAPGSTVRVTGVCDDETAGSPLNILLRTPADVAVLSGPPWWTWRKTAALVGTLLAIAFGALMWVYLLRRRLERQQAAQLAFSRQVLERVEEERRRIAANLHDSLGQVLLGIKNHALLAMQLDPKGKALQDRLKEISGTTSQAIDEVRQITHGLRPYQLDRLGLTQAIRASVTGASENRSIDFAVRVEDIDSLFDKDSEIHVYRIVQEAVNNIIKHSKATEATVVIKVRTGAVTLSIRDNGRGFDSNKLSSDSHDIGYGLRGMAERVRILGGVIAIESQPGQGLSLNIEVPLKKV